MSTPDNSGPLALGFVGSVVLIAISLSGCSADSHKADKSGQASYFAKKMECHKYETEILRGMEKNQFYSQSLERLFYSPSLDTCVAMIHRLPNSGTGNIQVEITDVLTEKVLWFAEYPLAGPGTKSDQQQIADADAEIQRNGWGEK